MLLADIETSLALFIPIMALMIPIVALLLRHQQKMAQLIHGQKQAMENPEVQMLRHEVQELKQALHEQTIAIDNLSRRGLPSSSDDRYSGV